MGRVRILLVNAIDEGSEAETQYFPLGLEYISSYLMQELEEKPIIRLVERDIFNEIDSFKPEIVGVSAVSQNFNKAKRIAKFAKSRGAFVIVGGVHISMLPESLDKNMDVGVMFEGEATFTELVGSYLNGDLENRLPKINGIVYHNKNRVRVNPPRALISPLDKIPPPLRGAYRKNDEIYLFSSRGCPFRCVFCASSRFWEKVRFYSAEYVISEIKDILSKYRVKRLNFYDDLFIADAARLRKLVELIRKEGINKRVEFTISVRAEMLNPENVKLLRRMNVTVANMGLESGTDRVLHYLKGGLASVEKNTRAINMLKDAGIQVSGSFIIGTPDETKEEILRTLEFIKKSRLDLFEVYVLVPFPGTPIWGYAVGKGFVSDKMDWDKLNIDFTRNYKKAIILSETLNREELQKLFLRFQKERKRRLLALMIKTAVKKPYLAVPFATRKIHAAARRWLSDGKKK